MFETLLSLLTLDHVGAAGVGAVGVVLSGMLKNGVAAVYLKSKSVISAVLAVKAKIDADAALALKVVQINTIPAKPVAVAVAGAPVVQIVATSPSLTVSPETVPVPAAS